VSSASEASDQSGADPDRLRVHRDRHLGRLLLRASRAFNTRAVEQLRARGHAGLTVAHIGLLPHLDEDGTRITLLAERAGMTKQGMGQLVLDLEHQGYLDRASDPSDRRATLVRFTEAGRQLLIDAVAITGELEAEYAGVLGDQRFGQLRAALDLLLDHESRRRSS
jgi:DNA-binding MarR family transcriptional regulator